MQTQQAGELCDEGCAIVLKRACAGAAAAGGDVAVVGGDGGEKAVDLIYTVGDLRVEGARLGGDLRCCAIQRSGQALRGGKRGLPRGGAAPVGSAAMALMPLKTLLMAA